MCFELNIRELRISQWSVRRFGKSNNKGNAENWVRDWPSSELLLVSGRMGKIVMVGRNVQYKKGYVYGKLLVIRDQF